MMLGGDSGDTEKEKRCVEQEDGCVKKCDRCDAF
jgi:hypothetical protein